MSGYNFSYAEITVEGIVGKMQGDGCAADAETVGIDHPFQGLRGVNGGGVGEIDVELGVGETGTIHQNGLLAEVDALRCEPQLLELSFDSQVADEAVGVDLRLSE